MSFVLEFSFEDQSYLWQTAQQVQAFIEPGAAERFALTDHLPEAKELVLPEILMSSPAFSDGSLLWCGTRSDALILLKIHRAAGHEAYFMVDKAADGQPVIITTWDFRVLQPKLDASEVFIELSAQSVTDELERNFETALAGFFSKHSAHLLGEPVYGQEDHGDHLHQAFEGVVRLPGENIDPLMGELQSELAVQALWRVVSKAE